MKQTMLTQGLVVALATAVGMTGYAGQYDQFIRLVNHRDANGNLVRPKKPVPSEVAQSTPDVKPMEAREPITENSMTPQPVSHVHPVSTEYSESLPMQDRNAVTVQPEQIPSQVKAHEPSSAMMAEEPGMSQHPVHVEAGPSFIDGSRPESEDGFSQESQASVDQPITLPEEKGMHRTQGEDGSSTEAVEEIVKKAVMPGQLKSYVFRSANWGMSIPEVKTKETAEFAWELDAPILLTGEHRLGYQTQVNGVDAFLTYGFEHDRLRNAKYLFQTEYVENHAQPILDYKTVKAWIVETYGLPQSEGKLWVNELYRYAPELWGRALMRGHLTIVDEWDVDGTNITLILNGGDEEVGLMAEFVTQDLASPTELVHAPPSTIEALSFRLLGRS